MRYADLSDTALQQALTSSAATSLVFLFRYVDGYQQASAGAYWDPVQGFRFGRDGYTESTVSTLGTLRIYPGATATPGAVDQADRRGRAVRPSVGADRADRRGARAAGRRRSRPVPATASTKRWPSRLANPAPLQEAQTYLYQTDNAPSFDFLLPGAPVAVGPVAPPGEGAVRRPGSERTDPGHGRSRRAGAARRSRAAGCVLGWRRLSARA